MIRPHVDAGFALVEALVALLVIAGMTGMLFETIAANARFAESVRQRREATMIARSLLEQATVPAGQDVLAPNGRTGNFRWRVARRAEVSEARDESVPLEEIRIDVTDIASGRLAATVRTLRLAR